MILEIVGTEHEVMGSVDCTDTLWRMENMTIRNESELICTVTVADVPRGMRCVSLTGQLTGTFLFSLPPGCTVVRPQDRTVFHRGSLHIDLRDIRPDGDR